jgi:tetratricopeptide (TPR) repeat protein
MNSLLFRYIVIISLLFGFGLSSLWAAGRNPNYLSSTSCSECHADTYQAWSNSHHSWAWRSANSDNVLGDFKNARFEHQGVISQFSTRNGRYYVKTNDAKGKSTTYEISYTVGVTPLQQYLVKLDDGRLQALDIAWDTEKSRWYHLYPNQKLKGDPGLHWTGPYKNWNARCATCHVTGYTKNYQTQSNTYQSKWSEIGVGCESCHGPGEAHITWAKHSKSTSLSAFKGVDAKGLTINFNKDSSEGELQLCASCHSRRESLGANSVAPNQLFANHYRLALLREGLYYADGQIQDEVYVYGSFLQSKMSQRGVSCSNCHDPHNAQLVTNVDGVCLQCHSPTGHKKFPTLKLTQYDTTTHHHHTPDSEGARCVNCHMPERTYMGVDARRDHSFRVPRPDLSVKLGVPNACNSCHKVRSASWAQNLISQWFPQGQHLQPHYGEVLQAGRQGLNQSSVTNLIKLAQNNAEPALVRASALELLAPGATPAVAAQTLPLLKDSSPLIRSATLSLFHNAPAKARAEYSSPLLTDPLRSVRIAAAQQILDIPTDKLSQADQAIVKTAVDEYHASLVALADFPVIQLNIARYAERVQKPKLARQSLQTALKLDSKLTEAWLHLAQLEVNTGKFDQAKLTLEKAINEKVSDSGMLYYLLGRVLVQLGDNTAAVQAFKQALQKIPTNLDIRVEYVSLLTKLSKYNDALKLLKATNKVAQFNPEVLYLMAYNYAKLNQHKQARYFAKMLLQHHPKDPLNKHLQSFL